MVSRKALLVSKTRNVLQSFLLLFLMGLLFSFIGFLFGGPTGLLVSLAVFVGIAVAAPQVSPQVILRMYGARKIDPREAPDLYAAVTVLSQRASLGNRPDLFYIPSSVMNAFSVGSRDAAGIALTDGILRRMSWREIGGILAHEISHVASNDLRIMALADSITRMINFFSFASILLLVFYLPITLATGYRVSIPAIALLALSPQISMLLQLALSRTREYEADLNAVRLTGDPGGLASALQKIEHRPRSMLDFLIPGRKEPGPSLLRSHPDTGRRVRRLMELAQRREEYPPFSYPRAVVPEHFNEVTAPPRRRIGGFWR